MTDGLTNVLVPVAGNRETEEAMDVACRLAADRRASVVALTVVEIPPVLPPDSHMTEEEARAHHLLERVAAIADLYGVRVTTRIVCARVAADAIVAEADARTTEIIVIGAPRHRRKPFGSTVEGVLTKARCRVLLISGAGTGQQVAA
jgi:nucleotide-binding universal stress UspA family protein